MLNLNNIGIVILSFNRADRIDSLINKVIIPSAELGAHLVIVDNGSDLDVIEKLKKTERLQNVELVLNNTNLGVAKGRNVGFKKITRPFIVYLDDDSIISMDDLIKVESFFTKLPEAGILAFKVVHGETNEPQTLHKDKKIQIGNFHGAGHAIRYSIFEKLGYLDEKCFFGAEELEFSMRALTIGMKTIYIPDILIKHYSVNRKGKVIFTRKLHWAKNFAMVLFRYLPAGKASLFCFRLFVSYFYNGIKDMTFGIFALPLAMIVGAYFGLNSKNRLNKNGTDFYTNDSTRPEIGNVSLSKKILNRI